MYKIKIITILFLSATATGFSQLQELHKAQETRKTYIDPSKTEPAKGDSVRLGSSRMAMGRDNYLRYVNPFIGTGGHGHTYPGAAVPFGMIQLSPDTRHDGWDGCSGYHYSDSVIYGFSHTHLSGTGVPDLCDILIVPQQGKALTEPGYSSPKGYGSPFSHKDEVATPGFYSVKLQKNNIDVKLYAAERSGLHEYTFNEAKGKKYILIDLDHRDELISAEIKAINNTTLSGHRHSKAWAGNQRLFFQMEVNTPFKSTLITEGKKHKMLLEFPESTKQVLLKIGISAVGVQGAATNLQKEIPEWSTTILHFQAEKRWAAELRKIEFKSPEQEVMVNFYTALYHAYLCPTLFTDADGNYLGNDGKIYNAGANDQYSIFSLWDTYRAAHPLYTLTQRERTEDFIQSFLRIYQQRGDLPVWELVGNETDCMIGYHSVSVILDAYRKGIRNFDAKLALEAMITTSKLNEYGKAPYAKNGFLGTDVEPESVSKTLEYAYDDWCIAEFAKELGNDSIYKIYSQRSYNFLNVFDPQTKFMRARRGGQWFSPFNPAEVNFNYTEANSWQYSLAAPQHLSTLREVIGGKDSLQIWLDKLFTTESKLAGREQVDITGLIGQYAHGNEPSHHMAYVYNYTNQPYQTQEKIDRILREMYHNAPDGLSGNEDCGQMSAWYVLSAMGIYPVCPGSPVYNIGRPLQTFANINFENGKSFTIRTQNNSPKNKYIQSMALNDKPYEKLFINHEDLLVGGSLLIVMGDQPNLKLNTFESDIPEKEIIPDNVVPVPYFTQTKRTFTDSITTEIKVLQLEKRENNEHFVTYTTDGSEPNVNSKDFPVTVTLKDNTVLKAQSFCATQLVTTDEKNKVVIGDIHETASNLSSVSTIFTKSSNNIALKLSTEYANQYAAGGENSLIDGLRSNSTDYRSGDWQGYQGVDASGVVFFKQAQKVSSVSISCLQDEHSWIFLPEMFTVEYSVDGEKYMPALVAKTATSPLKEGQLSEQLTVTFPAAVEVKSIRFTAKNRGVCPAGHISAGGKSWIFVDEVIIQ